MGVSHQYCGSVGKQANCQVSVELVVSDGAVAAPVGGRLYLPQKWTEDRPRCAAAGVPEEVAFATKPQIAVALLEEALADGVCPGPVLADSAYGDNSDFRAATATVEAGILCASDRLLAQGVDQSSANGAQIQAALCERLGPGFPNPGGK